MREIKIDHRRFSGTSLLRDEQYTVAKAEEIRLAAKATSFAEARSIIELNTTELITDDALEDRVGQQMYCRWITIKVTAGKNEFKIIFYAGLKDHIEEESDFRGNEDHIFQSNQLSWIELGWHLVNRVLNFNDLLKDIQVSVMDSLSNMMLSPRLPEPYQGSMDWDTIPPVEPEKVYVQQDRYIIMTQKVEYFMDDGSEMEMMSEIVGMGGDDLRDAAEVVRRVVDRFMDDAEKAGYGVSGLDEGAAIYGHAFSIMYYMSAPDGRLFRHYFHIVDTKKLPTLAQIEEIMQGDQDAPAV